MNTSLECLPAEKRCQLETITGIIEKAVRPEKVILFGVHAAMAIGGQDLPADKELAAFIGYYDLLIVTRRGDGRLDHELQDIVENRCRAYGMVNVIVHDIDYVNAKLKEGHYFFSMLLQEATLLYDAGKVPLVKGGKLDYLRIKQTAMKDFARWGMQARAFYKNALFNREENEPKIAVFMLHQAAEQMYQAILLTFTGYKPCTHNLDKLRRYTNRFSLELALLFHRHFKEEEQLFKLLLQGYVDARYKEDYSITLEELDQLIDRVGHLLSIGERVCQNRFATLDKLHEATRSSSE